MGEVRVGDSECSESLTDRGGTGSGSGCGRGSGMGRGQSRSSDSRLLSLESQPAATKEALRKAITAKGPSLRQTLVRSTGILCLTRQLDFGSRTRLQEKAWRCVSTWTM